MYYKNGKKVKYIPKSSAALPTKEVKSQSKPVKKRGCPAWIFIILGIIAMGIAIWLIIAIIKDKKKSLV